MMLPVVFRLGALHRPIVPLSPSQTAALRQFRTKLAQGHYAFEPAPCLCGRATGTLVARRDRYALPVTTYLCPNCGTLWTSPRLTVPSLAHFYETDYRPLYMGPEFTGEFFLANQVQRGQNILEFLAPEVQADQRRVVFDVGCGAGGTLLPFARAGWSAFGCDLGSTYLHLGRSAGLVLEQGEASVLAPYAPASLIILSHVVEHLPDPVASLRALQPLLGAGGLVYVEVPGVLNLHRTYGDVMRFLQNAHLYHFTLATLTALMARAGYALVRGDERICALFRPAAAAQPPASPAEYRRVLRYLYFAELERLSKRHRSVRVARRLAGRAVRALAGAGGLQRLRGSLGWPPR